MSFDQHVAGFELGGAGLVDLHERQQLGPVGNGPVGLGVTAEVGHRAVLHGVRAEHLGDLHRLALVGHVGLDGLVRVVDLPELDHVDADDLLVGLQVLHPIADVLGPGAVVAHDDFFADVDGGEARRRGVDVEQVVVLVLRERLGLGPLGRLLRAVFDIGLDLGAGHLDERAVTHAGSDLGFQTHHLHCFASHRLASDHGISARAPPATPSQALRRAQVRERRQARPSETNRSSTAMQRLAPSRRATTSVVQSTKLGGCGPDAGSISSASACSPG